MTIAGIVGTGLKTILSPVTSLAAGATNSLASAGLNAIGSWVLDGTESALRTVAHVIGTATAPNLESTWFGSAYWRVAGLATLLTMPFLFAAAVQALVRSDLGLLARSAFVYMPLSLIAVGLAAPLTMLLLAATDQMSAAVSAVGIEGGASFLDSAAAAAAGYAAVDGSPFFAVVIGLFALMAALALAVEMLIREAAVYVVVLMLPLGFAAMVWPARRIWATRLIELLVSLILSKFVIVAVLSLAGAAFANGSTGGISKLLVAMTLVLLSVFAPWTLMRILPFTEVAAGAAGALRRELPAMGYKEAANAARGMVDPAQGLAAKLGGSVTGESDESDGKQSPLKGFVEPRPSAGGYGAGGYGPGGYGYGYGSPSAAGYADAGAAASDASADAWEDTDGAFLGAGEAASGPSTGGGADAARALGAGAGPGSGGDPGDRGGSGGGGLGAGAGSGGGGDAGADSSVSGDAGAGHDAGAGGSPARIGGTGSEPAAGSRLDGMDAHWAHDWEPHGLDTDVIRDGLLFTPPGADEPVSSLDWLRSDTDGASQPDGAMPANDATAGVDPYDGTDGLS